jgi:adenylate cyclase
MAEELEANDPKQERLDAEWRAILVDGHGKLNKARHLFRRIPSSPRCKECYSPFKGPGGIITRLMGMRRSPKNPNFCDPCLTGMPPGGIETDVAVLFADVRGSTTMGEGMGSKHYADLLNRFYKTATTVLLDQDAIIDKLIGDEVMALFVPGFAGKDYRRRAVLAGEGLLRAVGNEPGREPWLPIGVAVHAGFAYVGNVGGQGIVDFTALGDTVNTAARLQALAQPGDLIVSAEVYEGVSDLYPGLKPEVHEIRGRGESVSIHRLSLRAPAVSPA